MSLLEAPIHLLQELPTSAPDGMSMADFLTLSARCRFELIQGRIIYKDVDPGTGDVGTVAYHAMILKVFYDTLLIYTMGKRIGKVFVETTFVLPDTDFRRWVKGSRVPDVLFYAQERDDSYIATHPDYRDYPYALVPDLVIEVISPGDSFEEVVEKVEQYLHDGVGVVWLANPKSREVRVYRSGDTEMTLRNDELLTNDLLPGFSLRVSELFA